MPSTTGQFPRKRREDARRDPAEWELVERALERGGVHYWPPDGLPSYREADRARRRLAWIAKANGGRLRTTVTQRKQRYRVAIERRDSE